MQEYEFKRPLGDAVKRIRGESGLTQNEVATRAGMDVRTVLNIENYRGNPKMQVIYPLVRVLKMDSNCIFYPELEQQSPALRQLRMMLATCSEEEAKALIPVFESVLSVLRSSKATTIE
jgi:transcriptional regulator with XRE-family HTH domain